MSVDTTDLELRILSTDVEKANKRLDRLENSSGKAQRATEGLTGAFKSLLGPIAALLSVTALASKLVEVQRQFDILNAGLITATKSSANAATAFEALQEFAQKTPYDLAQAVDGFTKLVNLGLTPSEKALMSYGNTASAMGKDLNQMIEAVADAATGEFERLKEFGIKSSVEGNKVTFTFQGVKTSIGNNAAEIEKYLMALGENQFAGAMQKRMDSLDGSIANLGDNWDSLFREVSASGVGDLIKQGVDLASSSLSEFTTMIKSGEIQSFLTASAIGWAEWGKGIEETLDILDTYIKLIWTAWGGDAESASKKMYLGFSEFPVEIRAYFQEATVEVATFFHNLGLEADLGMGLVKAAFSKDDTFAGVKQKYNEQMKVSNQTYTSMIDDISQEKDASLAAINEQLIAGKDLRAEFDRQLEARRKLSEDRLAQYKVGGTDDSGGGLSKAEQKKAEALARQRKKEFDDLVSSLNTEEESIQVSYDKRKAIIEKNTTAESAARANLMARLDKDHQKELDQLHEVEDARTKALRLFEEYSDIQESGWTDQQKAANEYQKQIESLWNAMQAGVISQTEQEAQVNRITAAYEKQADKASGTYFDIEELGKQAARNVQDAFADFLFDPFSEGLDGMLVGFLKVLQRMAAEAAAAQLTKSLFGSGGSDGGTGILGSLVGAAASYFGGGASVDTSAIGAQASSYSNLSGFTLGRASGGPTTPGQPYEVAERGPELYSSNGRTFLLDGAGGTVTPLSGAGGTGGSGGDINVDITVVIQSDGSSTDKTSTTDNMAGNQLAQTMRGVAVKAIQEEMAPGGILWGMRENTNG